MRHRLNPTIALLPLAFLAACSQQKSEEAAATSEEVAAASDAALPDVAAVAPGVAFTFAYAFTLPAEKVSDVQQRHAAACGQLGLDRCRVTGMDYRQPAEGEAEGRLDLLLAPEAAPAFGREAVELVKAAEGKVADATVSGENAGGAIDASHQTSRGLKAEMARIEARLATRSLTRESRTELESRLTELRRELASQGEARARAEKSLATTPVTLTYASEGLLGSGNAFTGAAKASWSSLTTLLSFLLVVGGGILPWAALGLLIWFAWRGLRRLEKSSENAA
ncbi:MAG: DUF4349 domain-containing protein [Pseudomonadota bacterium]